MSCRWWRGHDWSAWGQSLGAATAGTDGKHYRQQFQHRTCEWCGLKEVKWLPSAQLVQPDGGEGS